MNDADTALILLTAAIFFSLVIERLLEIAKTIYNYIEVRNGLSDFWNRRATRIRERLQNRLEKTKENGLQNAVFKYLASRYVSKDHPGYEGAPVISAAKLRAFTVKGVSKGTAVILGIAIVFALDINVFALIAQWTDTPNAITLELFREKDPRISLPQWLEYTITGIIMGLGSGPMHKFISALERAKSNRQSTEKT